MTKDEYYNTFSPFADPATDVHVDEKNNIFIVELYRDGTPKKYSIDSKSLSVRNLDDNRKYPNLNSLLASNEFADLKSLAATQVRMLAPIGEAPFLSPNFYLPHSNSKLTGIDNLDSILCDKPSNTTSICLLDGPAGIGKTRLLQKLTWERANKYAVTGQAPILYVGSRGAKLSNLRAELAAATQQLRANFTFDQVPILVRRGLLDIAIDGFDELVDADGYHDAWHALQSFLSEISGSGVCILAGRDTFFDQQGFFERLNTSQYSTNLVQFHLLLADPSQAQKWLQENGWKQSSIDNVQSILRHNSYALRPYFLSVLAKSPDWEAKENSNTVRAFLVNNFLDRESNIIKGMLGGNNSEIRSALRQMFESAATDMFEREQGEIDIEYLGLLCELAFENHFAVEDVRKLTHKAGSFGLLEPGTSSRLRRFPHSEILHYFLSRALVDDLSAGKINLALRRGVLGTDFLEVFQEVVEYENSTIVEKALSNLYRFVQIDFSSDRLPNNGGAILLGSLTKSLGTSPRVLEGLTVNECSLSGQIAAAELKKINIFRLDARGADFSEVQFCDVVVSVLIVDDFTKFGATAPEIATIHISEDAKVESLHDPQKISKWIETHSTLVEENYEEFPLFKFFEKICRKAIRQFYFKYSDYDPDHTSEFLIDPMWPTVAEILRKHGRLDEVTKSLSGPPSVMHHIRDPKSLIKPEDDNSFAIREDIIAAARAWGT